MIRIALIACLLAIWYFWVCWRKAPDNEARRRLINQFLLYGLLAAIILLAAAGRIHWLGAVFAALFPVLKLLAGWLFGLFPILAKIYGKRAPASQVGGGNQRSSIRTDSLEMWLDHETGEMGGILLKGEFAGQTLEGLDQATLSNLYDKLLSDDPDSARLLQSYLQRRFADFEAGSDQQDGQTDAGTSNQGANMSETEARQILGVDDQATPADIRKAHRKLMQKLHPDHGGNDYFAAKINQARDLLLGR